MPCVGHWSKMLHPTCAVVNAVIQLYSLIPVIAIRLCTEAVVAGGLSRHFVVRFLLDARHIKSACQSLARDIVEIVLRTKGLLRIIIATEFAAVLSTHMVGHKVHHHFHARLMNASQHRLKLCHSFIRANGEVRVNVVVILDSIRRAGPPFDHCAMVAWYSVVRVVSLGRMFYKTCRPDMSYAHCLYLAER